MNTLSELRNYVSTLSSLSCTRLPFTKWLDYAKCMLFGMSIRKSAEIIDVCVKTSFYMRHKILDCLHEYLGVGSVKGIVEVDETFHAVSYKDNHKKSGFVLPRPARRRGHEVKLRGMSKEQVCTGRVGVNELDELFKAEKDVVKGNNILIHSTVPSVDTRIETYQQRQAAFL